LAKCSGKLGCGTSGLGWKEVFSRANSMVSQSWCNVLTYQNGNIINENICN
jgi:hypothetical protein